MLGYIVTYKPELKVREAEWYKAYYCGVCKSISRRFGQLPRMVLSYDAAFLAMVIDSVFDEKEHWTRERCMANPLKKKPIASSEAIDFAADIMIILAWHKILDDIRDENDKKAKIFERFIKNKYEKLQHERPGICSKIENRLKSLEEIEERKCANLDEAAEVFAKLMEEVFVEGLIAVNSAHEMEALYDESDSENIQATKREADIEIEKAVLARVGYHIGKWVYLIDAVDDVEDNIKTGAYNPLIYRFQYNEDETAQGFKERIREDVRGNLMIYLAEIAKTMDLLRLKKNQGIIENIIYVGLLEKTDEVLNKGEENE